MRVLEALGVIGVKRGPDHGAVVLQEPGNAFNTVLELLVALGHVPLGDVIEFRAMVESSAARRLAVHHIPDAIGVMGAALGVMDDSHTARIDFHAADADFHLACVHSGGNRLIDLVGRAADSAVRRLIVDVELVENWDEIRPRLQSEHREIFDAISSGNAARAAQLVDAHVRHWGASVREALGARDGEPPH